jgi:hypothetical protein
MGNSSRSADTVLVSEFSILRRKAFSWVNRLCSILPRKLSLGKQQKESAKCSIESVARIKFRWLRPWLRAPGQKEQASGFFLKAGSGIAGESAPLAIDASPGVAASANVCRN